MDRSLSATENSSILTGDLPQKVLEDDDLQKIRDEYEEHLDLKALFLPSRDQGKGNLVCAILKDPVAGEGHQYYCHRYMKRIDGEWDCSLDAQGTSEEKALGWISSPRALPNSS